MQAKNRVADTIVLTGEVWDWADGPSLEETIFEDQVEKFEKDGFSVVPFNGELLAFKSARHPDGDVTIQPKSDAGGRSAAAGGHANYGYSGYFRAYVYLDGQRKTLVDFWKMFEPDGHRYAAQQDKLATAATIRQMIGDLAGSTVVKVKGGYAFRPDEQAAGEPT